MQGVDAVGGGAMTHSATTVSLPVLDGRKVFYVCLPQKMSQASFDHLLELLDLYRPALVRQPPMWCWEI